MLVVGDKERNKGRNFTMIRIKIKAIAVDIHGIEQEVEFEIPVMGQWTEGDKIVACVDMGYDDNVRVEFTPNPNFKSFQ